jgi:LPXTG-site transpeptidase (sortase) family protein
MNVSRIIIFIVGFGLVRAAAMGLFTPAQATSAPMVLSITLTPSPEGPLETPTAPPPQPTQPPVIPPTEVPPTATQVPDPRPTEQPPTPTEPSPTPTELPPGPSPADNPQPTPVLLPRAGLNGAAAWSGEGLSPAEEPTAPLAYLIIPELDVAAPVLPVYTSRGSWDIQTLGDSVAWLGETARPGSDGRSVLAAHVTGSTGPGPFRILHRVTFDSLIWVDLGDRVLAYRVREKKVVDPGDMSVLLPGDGPQLTLLTCIGWDEEQHKYLKRLVVVADLVTTAAQLPKDGVPGAGRR